MSLILNIDTSSEKAHVSFAKDGSLLALLSSESQKEHASFLQSAIQQLCKTASIHLPEIDAVAVTAGPGSYTGLRVGMASAKGLSYALKKPFITMGTLEILARSAMDLFPDQPETVLYCPMMDARRMEVFTAIYQKDLNAILEPGAMVLDESSFEAHLLTHKILFFGSGSAKWKATCKNMNALFENVEIQPQTMCMQANSLFMQKDFTDLAYSEPMYLKDFQIVIKK
ncbi:MAG: tRNA (adenosine(37)-N6)-threonylcarbamoyltransferase complex dimerization subunit type 1 TsaB [Chitinophagaceae bacterium]|nr:tRNA (adenosine(37)-N6)-threonylcarbamoyltransferase complex dimerization subunit type 1 TsaB [Chitinophagaceae bacterium]